MDPIPIFADNNEKGLVAVDPVGTNNAQHQEMGLYFRKGNKTIRKEEPFTPFILLKDKKLLNAYSGKPSLRRLNNGEGLKILACFLSWEEYKRAKTYFVKQTGYTASAANAPFLAINDAVEQYLILSGRSLFKSMTFEGLRRMQLDIETHTTPGFEFCNPERKTDRIIIIALSDESGWQEILWNRSGNEKELLERLVQRIQERDPDIIEGHNIFKFDLPYIAERARQHNVPLTLGRDGSLLRSHPSRLTLADRMFSFPKFEITGRHIIDTFLLLQIYDVSHRSLEGFGLKQAAVHFNIAAPTRTYINGSQISTLFDSDPEKVIRYASDDIKETRALSAILSRTYFVQAQMLPFSYHTVCLRGNAAKIDAMMIREYIRRDHAIPLSEPPITFEGGYTAICSTGIIKNVHHCDVRSLYPSIMIAEKKAPKCDQLGVFLQLLSYLREYRLDAKQKMQTSKNKEEKAHFESLQTTFKILINSFYGYLGFAQGHFNDFEKAREVAARGRSIVNDMVKWLRANGANPVEIDTDGIYYVPPHLKNEKEKKAFQKAFQKSLPPGINIEFDGEYRSMFSYKMKNYALLEHSGKIIIKGGALKSRGLEPYLRAFLKELIRLKLQAKEKDLHALKNRYEQAISEGSLPIRQLAKTETLSDAPALYAQKVARRRRGRNAAYELALKSERNYQAGDQISYYITGTKKKVAAFQAAKLVSDWNKKERDENIAYYIAKLHALYERFATN